MKSDSILYSIIDKILNSEHLNGSNEQKIKNYHVNFVDIDSRNELGINIFNKYFNQIDDIKNINQLQQYLAEVTPIGNNPFYTFSVDVDLKNSNHKIINLGEANLTLTKNYYQSKDEHNQLIINSLSNYINNILPLIENKSKNFNAQKIIAFENQIAQLLNTTEEDLIPENNYNIYLEEEIKSISKNIDFRKYINSFGIKPVKVVIGSLNYFKNIDNIINSENLPFIKDYLKYKLISDYSQYSTEGLRTNHFKLFEKSINGQSVDLDLESLALASTNENFGDLIGQYYVKDNFSFEDKSKAKELVNIILDVFKERIENLDWMSNETKLRALDKLSKMEMKIGYPEKWEDYSDLTITSKDNGGNIIENLEEIRKWTFNKPLKSFNQPIDELLWVGTTVHEVNAFYETSTNTIILPAGILQPPFFDKNADPAINFGFIGAIIGHEITHGFDNIGAKFDANGNLSNWWEKEDEIKFNNLITQLKNQFNTYEPYKGIFVNGELTSSENIADLGGLSLAYEAFNQYIIKHGLNEKINGFTPQERFFMAYAASWRSKETKEYLTNLIKTDTHSPSYYRVMGIVNNLDSFHEVFKTKSGDKLYKEPKNRIRIW